MSNKKLHSFHSHSPTTSLSSLHDHKYNLLSKQNSFTTKIQPDQTNLTKEEIQQELLRAFDTQMSFGQKQLPTGLSSRQKQKVRSVSLHSASLPRPEPLKPSLIQNQQTNPIPKPHSHINSSHPTHRSTKSQSSQLSSMKSFHHNRRQSITSEFLAKKQTQKLVQKLLTVKPSKEVSREKHMESYSKHLQSKHIMMHRFQNDKKGVILVKKTNCCSQHTTVLLKDLHAKKNEELREKKFNAIELKEIQLRKMLKDQKRKNRLQTIKKIDPKRVPMVKKTHERVKTLDANLMGKKLPVTSASSQKSSYLPKIRAFSKAETYQKNGFVTSGGESSNNSRGPKLLKHRMKTMF